MHYSATLGFHAPYLGTLPGDSYSRDDVGASYATAIAGIRDLLKLGATGGREGTEILPAGIVLEMLSRRPDELFLIDSVGQAIKADITIFGLSRLPTIVDAKELCNCCANLFFASAPDISFTPFADMCERPKENHTYTSRGDLIYINGFGSGIHVFKEYCLIRKGVRGFEVLRRLLYDDREGYSTNDFKLVDRLWFFAPDQKLNTLH